MKPNIPHELENAVIMHPDGFLKVQGSNGTYWLMTDSAMQIHADVQQGLEQSDRGKVESWDAGEIKLEGRRLQQERSNNA